MAAPQRGATPDGYPRKVINIPVEAATVSRYVEQLDPNGPDYELVSAEAIYDVTSTSGVAKIYNCAATNAPASGTAMLTSAGIDLAGTARTKVVGALSTTTGAVRIPAGNAIALGISGTMTNLVGGVITLVLKPVS